MKQLLGLFIITCLFSCIVNSEPFRVYVYDVVRTPTENESITLKNNRIEKDAANLSAWTLGDSNHPTSYRIPNNTILDYQKTITFSHTTLGFQIDDTDETIYLKDSSGKTIEELYLP